MNATAQDERTPESRAAFGRAARDATPVASLGGYTPAQDRPDPVALLQRQSATRVPELVPVRYGRMLVSPFTFFRGAALIMASDLSGGPRSPLEAQLCGDAHLSNFGGFASPERRLVFDINDFDETHPGPFEWDLKRLVTSLEVAGRHRGFTKKQRTQIVRATSASYRDAMGALADRGNLDVWYSSVDIEAIVKALQPHMDKRAQRRSDRGLTKARTRNSLQAATKLTNVVKGVRRFVDNPPVIERAETMLERSGVDPGQVEAALPASWAAYLSSMQGDRRHLLGDYTFVDLAFKVVGVGSVGTRAWIMLMQGRDASDLLLLQLKEAQRSVLEDFTRPSEYSQCGERVVQGQRILQSASDIFLGWTTVLGIDYYVRQLRDWKVSLDVETLDPAGLEIYGRMCGGTLAKGHARSGDRIALSAYLGKGEAFDDAMVSFARAYADQNERDYANFRHSVESGHIAAVTGV